MLWTTTKPGYPFSDSTFPESSSSSSDKKKGNSAKKSRPSPLEKRTVNHKIFGHIPGVPVGRTWSTRFECHLSGVHAGGFIKGISGCQDQGAYSIVLSGGYEDDIDLGQIFTYTGSGGRDTSHRTGPQTHDQSFDHPPNKSLKVSASTGRPVRVVRGFKLNSVYAPTAGYRYDGLYQVMSAKLEAGKSGFAMCKYQFRRLPDQPPLPSCGVAPVIKSEGRVAPRPSFKPVVKREPVGEPRLSASTSAARKTTDSSRTKLKMEIIQADHRASSSK